MTTAHVAERRCFDADSHIMDVPGEWLASYADHNVRERIANLEVPNDLRTTEHAAALERARDASQARHDDPQALADAEAQVLQTRLYSALGAWDPRERSRALDVLGFERQLVFATAALGAMNVDVNLELAYAVARAHNRGMAEFCGADERLVGVGYVPMWDIDAALAELDSALNGGCGAILIPTCPPPGGPSPTHPSLDPFWSRLEEADVPFVLHVAFNLRPIGGWNTVPTGFQHNAKPEVRGLRPGGETPDAYGYVAVAHPAQMLLAYMIFDGLFERFPQLRGACIEQSATWLPSWLRHVDLAFSQIRRKHPHFQELTMRPSDYVHRHLKFTPFYFEPVGWIIDQVGDDLLMFASDYPHVEGGTDPIGSFESSMPDVSDTAKERFYLTNMSELLGVAPAN